ncbi:MAG: hypothetical protein LAT65_12100 [Saccharospirillum sp.]|nr:hypothetical protein [Saccharospirillum sp.]
MHFRPMVEADRALPFVGSNAWSRDYWSAQLWSLQRLEVARAWVLANPSEVVAWFGLQPMSLVLRGAEEATSVALAPKPVVGLCGLAVSEPKQRAGLGRWALQVALKQALTELETRGGVGVIAQAPTTEAERWLAGSGVFEPLNEDRGLLFVSYGSLQGWRRKGWL